MPVAFSHWVLTHPCILVFYLPLHSFILSYLNAHLSNLDAHRLDYYSHYLIMFTFVYTFLVHSI